MNKLEFSPLSGSDLQLKATLKKKYQSFWNNLAFRRGQARPIFSVSEADALLDRAAELVVLIRRAYQQAGVRLPNQIEGHSSDFLWTAVVLHLNPATFVRDLVHASLSDADGYFEGVNADDVDAAIESLDRSYMQHEAKNLGSEEARLRSDILKNAEPVIKLVKELFSNPDDTLIMDDVDAQMAKLRISTLQSIKSTLSNLEKHLHVLHRQQLGDSGTTTPTSQKASTSSDKEAAHTTKTQWSSMRQDTSIMLPSTCSHLHEEEKEHRQHLTRARRRRRRNSSSSSSSNITLKMNTPRRGRGR